MYSPYAAIDSGTPVGMGAPMGGGVSSGTGARTVPSGVHPWAHWAVIAWFLIAAGALMLLDKGGFRFMVTVGKR